MCLRVHIEQTLHQVWSFYLLTDEYIPEQSRCSAAFHLLCSQGKARQSDKKIFIYNNLHTEEMEALRHHVL